MSRMVFSVPFASTIKSDIGFSFWYSINFVTSAKYSFGVPYLKKLKHIFMQKLTVSASRIRSLLENFSLIAICSILSRISKIEISWNYLLFKIQTLSEIVERQKLLLCLDISFKKRIQILRLGDGVGNEIEFTAFNFVESFVYEPLKWRMD